MSCDTHSVEPPSSEDLGELVAQVVVRSALQRPGAVADADLDAEDGTGAGGRLVRARAVALETDLGPDREEAVLAGVVAQLNEDGRPQHEAVAGDHGVDDRGARERAAVADARADGRDATDIEQQVSADAEGGVETLPRAVGAEQHGAVRTVAVPGLVAADHEAEAAATQGRVAEHGGLLVVGALVDGEAHALHAEDPTAGERGEVDTVALGGPDGGLMEIQPPGVLLRESAGLHDEAGEGVHPLGVAGDEDILLVVAQVGLVHASGEVGLAVFQRVEARVDVGVDVVDDQAVHGLTADATTTAAPLGLEALGGRDGDDVDAAAHAEVGGAVGQRVAGGTVGDGPDGAVGAVVADGVLRIAHQEGPVGGVDLAERAEVAGLHVDGELGLGELPASAVPAPLLPGANLGVGADAQSVVTALAVVVLAIARDLLGAGVDLVIAVLAVELAGGVDIVLVDGAVAGDVDAGEGAAARLGRESGLGNGREVAITVVVDELAGTLLTRVGLRGVDGEGGAEAQEETGEDGHAVAVHGCSCGR